MQMKNTTLFVIALFLCTQLMAQSELKTKSISIFKNGKSFVTKEANVSTNNGVYTLNEIPNALYGTLWFIGPQANVVEVTSKSDKVEESIERKASNFTELLYANKGKPFVLTTHDDKVYTGTVEDFDLPEKAEVQTLLVKADGKWVAIQPSSIKTIEFANKPNSMFKQSKEEQKPLIKVKFAKSGNQPLSMMYLQDGLLWLPTYLLELESDTRANLSMQAEVVNDMEDITNANINFVVGVPNFKYADQPATLTSFAERVYRETNYYVNDRANMFSNALMTQVMSESSSSMSDESVLEGVDADASEDFYFYSINNLSLEKGSRAHYPLFNAPIKIKHLYECNLTGAQDFRNSRYYADDIAEYSFDIKRSNVFHSIEIKNESNMPFTTGSVMIIDKRTQRPLAEDLIKYTGSGQSSSIQLSQSPDIRVEEEEKILNVKERAKRRSGDDYTLFTIQGEVTIVNSKKEEIEMAVKKSITGEIKSATIEYDSIKAPLTGGYGNINPQDKLNFNLKVKAGETKKFTYTYEMYVRE